jgi:23S rRNA (adenine2503-C2)-methyltransferase
MRTLQNIKVPTGNILVVEGQHGKLECLSLGDYGKDVNVKADFLGLSRELGKVEHQELLPLEDKWVITISTQYGCSIGCNFCDVPKVGKGRNATKHDLINQVITALNQHPNVQAKRINLHYARMGEPTFNPAVMEATYFLAGMFTGAGFGFHPVVSTMMPWKNKTSTFIQQWCELKNEFLEGNAGLQISINSTNEGERDEMFNGNAMSLATMSRMFHSPMFPAPIGRKYTLNFAVADYEIDAGRLRDLFSPDDFIVKLTPMHKTASALENDIKTAGDYTEYYPYQHHEEALRKEGFDVLVFVASKEEDEGRITCGNAILSGTKPFDFNE